MTTQHPAAVAVLLAAAAVPVADAVITEGPTGACCLDGNVCIENVTAVFCIVTVGGFYQGDGISCFGDCGTCCGPPSCPENEKYECHQHWSPSRCAHAGGCFLGPLQWIEHCVPATPVRHTPDILSG